MLGSLVNHCKNHCKTTVKNQTANVRENGINKCSKHMHRQHSHHFREVVTSQKEERERKRKRERERRGKS